MNSKNEDTILQIIKYTPPIFIITLSLIISVALYFNNQKMFNEEKKQIEQEYIKDKKELIQNQVNNIYEYIINEQKDTEEKLKQSIKMRVYEAYNIAMNIYQENKNLDKVAIKKLITDALRTIRFNNNRGYFFIFSFDGKNILNSAFPNLEGKDLWNYKDAKGTFITHEMNKILSKKNETFYTWYWNKPNDKSLTEYKKIGFFKKIEPLNWYIGTGEYLEDFENDIKKDLLKYIKRLKYENNGYIFIIDYKGKYLAHKNEEIIGLNALEAKDIQNKQTILDIFDISKKQGSGFIDYFQIKKSGINNLAKKTSYIKSIENWEWIIGKGFYQDERNLIFKKKKQFLDEKLNEHLCDLVFYSSLLTIILLFISISISKILEKRFVGYQNEINTYLKEITTQHTILAQQSKLAAVGEMIANIAHQWRQPLSMISSAATGLRLKKEVGILKDEEFNTSLDYINDSTQYLSKTIDDFRNFFSNNKDKTLFSIKTAIQESLNLLSIQTKENDITIIQDINESKVFGVKSEISQVIINIINNSKDQLIKSRKKNRLITVNTYEKDNFLIIDLKDNAGGIKEKVLPHIFEPYFTTKHKSQGTGIGLYMSRQIILKQYQGAIDITNCEFSYEKKSYKGANTIIKLNISKN